MSGLLLRLFASISSLIRGAERSKDSPEELLRRFETFLRHAKAGEEFTFEYLVSKLSPSSPEDLAAVLAMMVRKGDLKQVVRIESPTTHGGIEDFPSLQEVPNEIRDWYTDREIQVRPEDLRVIYSPAWLTANSHEPALR